MSFAKIEYKKIDVKNYEYFILGGDIGGTNVNLGIFGVKNNFPALLLSFHFKSQELRGLHFGINRVLSYIKKNYQLSVTKSCFAVAGPLSSNKDFSKITNAKLHVSKKELLKKTNLRNIILINDFEAIGYGINMLNKNDIIIIKKAKKVPKAPILVIGAGTGLGKAALIYSEYCQSYAPIPSEAGHSDFPAQSQAEFELINFIKNDKKIRENVSYEQVLSGQGLTNIYNFLGKGGKFKETQYTREIDNANGSPEMISKYRTVDETCKAAFKMFTKFYAACAKNFALDCLPYGGIYIAGGIAPKNRNIFDNEFVKIFEGNYKLKEVLKNIPIYLIINQNVGLLGAGVCGTKFLK